MHTREAVTEARLRPGDRALIDAYLAEVARGPAAGPVHPRVGARIGRTAKAVCVRLSELRRAGLELPRVAPERSRRHVPPADLSGPLRPCLRCGEPFASAGPGNRLCDPCRARVAALAPVCGVYPE